MHELKRRSATTQALIFDRVAYIGIYHYIAFREFRRHLEQCFVIGQVGDRGIQRLGEWRAGRDRRDHHNNEGT